MADVKDNLLKMTKSWMNEYEDRFFDQSDFMNAMPDSMWLKPPYRRPVDLMKEYSKTR